MGGGEEWRGRCLVCDRGALAKMQERGSPLSVAPWMLMGIALWGSSALRHFWAERIDAGMSGQVSSLLHLLLLPPLVTTRLGATYCG